MKKILSLVFLSVSLFGMYPEVEVVKVSVAEIKDQLVSIMSDKDFNIIESGDYKLDFRKDYQAGESGWQRALLQAVDGSNIDSYGVEYTILPKKEKIIIKGRPYLLKTFRFNQKPEQKMDLLNNQEAVDKVQENLDRLQRVLEYDHKKEDIKPVEVKVESSLFITNEQKCNALQKSWIYEGEQKAWGCRVFQKDLQ